MPALEPAAAVEPAPQGPGRFFYGGQAVVEGVMMRGPSCYAVAVRMLGSGQIRVLRGELKAAIYTHRIWRWPFLRGLAVLAEQLHLGTKSLSWSARVAAGAQDLEIGSGAIAVSLGTALAFSVGLFFGLPLLGASLAVHGPGSFGFVLVEGALRVALVMAYLLAVGLLPEVRRIFQYHGAEHKAINTFEMGLPLDVPHARLASVLHPRCGTGFLLVVLGVSVLVFSLVAVLHPSLPWVVVSRALGLGVITSL
ncbi:MAG TPA: DUF1385 domain-containing protein, partial [Candidatus Dormibacteraeota bacterium]|nr:DUF1385 domain-containing protein [Candidatus Dormibacteraeota bacterium]